MSEERKRILNMVSEGKISVEDAENLLAAVEFPVAAPAVIEVAENRSATNAPSRVELEEAMDNTKPRKKPQYLRVLVDQPGNRVDVRVPLAVLHAGLNFVKMMPPWAVEQANKSLQQKGMMVDLKSVDPKMIGELIEKLSDASVDVQQEGNKVRVFCE